MKSILIFTLPLMLSILFQQLYNAVDIVIVGHYLGEESLAAIGASIPVYELLIGFGNGFGNGLGVVAAKAYGAGDKEKLKKVVAGSLVITLCVTLIIVVFGQFGLKPLLSLLGTPEELRAEANSYIWVIVTCAGILFLYNLLSGLLRAIGNSFMPLVFLIISSFLNIGLDILLISIFHWGIRGTAIATVVSQGISVVLCLIYTLRKTKILIPNKESFNVGSRTYKELVGQGISMALMGSLVSSGTLILQYAVNSFGSLIIAGHVSARKLFAITTIPLFALSLATATYVSQNYGAGKIDRIKRGILILYAITTVWSVLCIIIVPFVSKSLIAIISGSTDAEVLNYGSRYLNFIQPFYIFLGVLLVTRNAFQGMDSKILSLASSMIEFLGKILFTIFIIPKMGTMGIIICEPMTWVVMTAQLLIAFLLHPIFRKEKAAAKN